MSEDSKDKPPAKLTLSRGLKAQADTEAAKVKAETAVNKPAPVMKLKRREEDSESPSTAASTAAGESPKAPPSTQTPSPADETPSEKKPAFDPKNPFGNSAASPIKAGEINPPRPTPSAPQQTQPTTPLTDDGASAKGAKGVKGVEGANVEQAISSLKSEEQEVRSKSILPSIIIIIILLIILAAAGFGLWKVLNLSKDDDVATAASSKNESAESIETSTPSSQAPQNPIEKAKATIAKVPTADVNVITAPPSVPVSPPAIVAPPEVEPKLPAAADSKASNSAIEANKQAVSQYLSSIHIGGLRKGERPMVILGGERFDVGDIVQAETGLKFDGLRNGRLAFRDHHGIVYLKSF